MKVMDKFFDFMGFTETREEIISEEETPFLEEIPDWKGKKSKGHVVPFNTSNKEQVRVILLEPASFDDCQQISDNLKNKRTVIINLENLDIGLARRIIDFVGGSAYALGGTLQKIGTGIIIAVPNNVNISGDISTISQPKEVLAWISKINSETDMRRY